jgi:hypothetical protein
MRRLAVLLPTNQRLGQVDQGADEPDHEQVESGKSTRLEVDSTMSRIQVSIWRRAKVMSGTTRRAGTAMMAANRQLNLIHSRSRPFGESQYSREARLWRNTSAERSMELSRWKSGSTVGKVSSLGCQWRNATLRARVTQLGGTTVGER